MATTNEGDAGEENTQVKFRFCKNCSNLLYPTEDRESNTLKFQCRHCNLSEDAETACVFRNDLSNAVGETAGITQDVGTDPTVGPPPSFCGLCGDCISCDDCGHPIDEAVQVISIKDNLIQCAEETPDEPPPDPFARMNDFFLNSPIFLDHLFHYYGDVESIDSSEGSSDGTDDQESEEKADSSNNS